MSQTTVSEGKSGDDSQPRPVAEAPAGAPGAPGEALGGSTAAVAATRLGRKAPRLDPLAVRRLLKTEGLKARHSLSQNFLADPDVLQAILDLATPAPGDRVLEVGPGLGVLTGALLEAGAAVTAVELDRRLAERLRDRHAVEIEAGRLRLVEGDILDQDIEALMGPPDRAGALGGADAGAPGGGPAGAAAAQTEPYEVVANVPYHITSPILHRFLGSGKGESGRGAGTARPRRMVLMLQREVAERIAARPGDMSYLSVFVQYHAEVRIAFVVPRAAFEPEPEVESAVVEIRVRDTSVDAAPRGRTETGPGMDVGVETTAALRPALDAGDEDDLWRLVQAGFRERRKKLHNVLSRQLPVPGDIVAGALEAAGIDGDRRPQTLSVEDWLALREALGPFPGSTARERKGAGGANSAAGARQAGGKRATGSKRAGGKPEPAARPGVRADHSARRAR